VIDSRLDAKALVVFDIDEDFDLIDDVLAPYWDATEAGYLHPLGDLISALVGVVVARLSAEPVRGRARHLARGPRSFPASSRHGVVVPARASGRGPRRMPTTQPR
jgi:hypothetical protein